MAYKVKTDVFEGPFDLLVYLIENAEMSIYDIKVSEITGQYLAYLETMKAGDVAVAAEFMVLAAVLIEIKSKMILPRFQPDGGFDPAEDPRTELVEKLLEYKKYKMASELLERQETLSLSIFEKPREDLALYTGEPDETLNLDLKQFAAAFHLFLQKKKRMEDVRRIYGRVRRQRHSVEDKIRGILRFFHLGKRREAVFEELTGENPGKDEKVVTFVSLLELSRQRKVRLKQPRAFGVITVQLGKEHERKQQVPEEEEKA